MRSKLWAISSQVMLWSSLGNKDLKMPIQIHLPSLLKLDGIWCSVFFGTHMSVKLIEWMGFFAASRKHNKCEDLWHRKGSDPCFIQRGSCLLLSICVANCSRLLKALFHPVWPFFFFFFSFFPFQVGFFF